MPLAYEIGCIHWDPTWKLNPIFLEWSFARLKSTIASELNGGGGGKEDFAMAGVPYIDSENLDTVVKKIIKRILEDI